MASVTTGVVIFTLRFTSEYNVVAEEPMLILATSPMASFSTSVSPSSSPTVGATSFTYALSVFSAELLS